MSLALLGLAALNPERLIADRNIDRFEQTGQLDAEYLSRLSADIDPALHRLPDRIRACVTTPGTPTATPGICSTSRGPAPIVPVDGPLSDFCTAFGRDEYSR